MRITEIILLFCILFSSSSCLVFKRYCPQQCENIDKNVFIIDPFFSDMILPKVTILHKKFDIVTLDSSHILVLKKYEEEIERGMFAMHESLVLSKEQILRNQIEKRKKRLNSARTNYHQLHLILERLVKLEATDRLLNIQYYKSTASRLNQNRSGLIFEVQSSFPDEINNTAFGNEAVNISKSFTQSLLRYCQLSEHLLNGKIAIYIEAADVKFLAQSIEPIIATLGIPYKIHMSQSSYTKVRFSLIADNFFEKELKKWIGLEQKLRLEIRILDRKIKNMKPN